MILHDLKKISENGFMSLLEGKLAESVTEFQYGPLEVYRNLQVKQPLTLKEALELEGELEIFCIITYS